MFTKLSKQLLVALVVLGASACSDSPVIMGDERSATQDTECPVAADIGVPQLTEAQMARVVMVVNMGEIEQAQLALQQSPAPRTEVRQYAERMLQEHTAANQQLQAALQSLGMTPEESLLSRQLMAEASQTLAILRATAAGEDFERSYMDVQVAMHAKTLFLMDSVIQPQLQRRELRDFARLARAEVQEHLNDALPIQNAIPPRP
jgi:putative membrane protein